MYCINAGIYFLTTCKLKGTVFVLDDLYKYSTRTQCKQTTKLYILSVKNSFVSGKANHRFYLLVSQTELKEYFLSASSVFLLSD